MLNFGNKEFRNLQEQVLKNAQDIETLKGRENLQIVIVEELPEEGNPNYIYLVPNNDEEEANVYDEYIWLADSEEYEKIGGVSIDLTNYVTLDTEQTITGPKAFSGANTFSGVTTYSSDIKLGEQWKINTTLNAAIIDIYRNNTLLYRIGSAGIYPNTTNTLDLGTSSVSWKDLYLSGYAIFNDSNYSNNIWKLMALNQFNLGIYRNNSLRYIFQQSQFAPATYQSAEINLGSANYPWKDLYLFGVISDGVNSVSVANIASKVTSTFISGTFDANGESTIDTEQAGTPEGLFIFTYGNCQCFLRLTATMISGADVTPIRIACPMIYNSDTVNGWLNITKSGAILILAITDGTNHVDSGYAWTLTKTNLI